jgi:3-isopropylmalate/(R)-2-methylmalate dehydratase small subunit
MNKFTTLEGVAAPLKIINVDTDMIIPKQYLKTIKRSGLGKGLFSEMRYNDRGEPNPDFVLNKPEYSGAQIIVAGDNFGCGSSREHAPWALLDYGIRCIIAPSFADIFYNNVFKNGMLACKLPVERVNELMRFLLELPGAKITVDLEAQTITGPDGKTDRFEIGGTSKHNLLNGLDEIGITLTKMPNIQDYEQKAASTRAWLG